MPFLLYDLAHLCKGVRLLHVQTVVGGECRHAYIAEAELPVQHVGRIRRHVFRQGYGDSHSPDLELQSLDKGPAVVVVVGQVPVPGAVTDGLSHEGVAEDFRTVQVLQFLDTVITDCLHGFQRLVHSGLDETRIILRHGLFQPRAVEGSDRYVEHLLRRAVF